MEDGRWRKGKAKRRRGCVRDSLKVETWSKLYFLGKVQPSLQGLIPPTP